MKKILSALLVSIFVFTGCQKQTVSTKDMIKEIYDTPVIELPLKKELGEDKFNALINVAASGVRALYDFPANVTPDQRNELVRGIFFTEQIGPAFVRANEVASSYKKCVVTINGIKDASSGTFHERVGYRVLLESVISTDKATENVVFQVILLVDDKGALKVYWAEPVK